MTPEKSAAPRRTQADRRAQTRAALLEAAARGISREGYGNLVLERVASDAGYTRGALYHHFADKEALALAVVGWGKLTWQREVGIVGAREPDPVKALLAMARAHAVYCRRDVARLMMVLRIELGVGDDPVARAVDDTIEEGFAFTGPMIQAGRDSGAIPPGPPVRIISQAYMGVLEGLMIQIAGETDYDEDLAEGVVRAVLGLPPAAA